MGTKTLIDCLVCTTAHHNKHLCDQCAKSSALAQDHPIRHVCEHCAVWTMAREELAKVAPSVWLSALPEVVEASIQLDEARNASKPRKARAPSFDDVLLAAGMFPEAAYQTPHHEAMRRLHADLARETDVDVRELREIADARCGDPQGRVAVLELLIVPDHLCMETH